MEHNKRRARARHRAIVSEVYSPPRVAAAARVLADLRIDPGLSMDITTTDEVGDAWGFSKHSMRAKAKRRLEEQDPELLVGSPMCTMYSPWQRINRFRDVSRYKREKKRARRHLEFVCELYHMQLARGRLFLHEHPAQADSWEELCHQTP